MKRFLITGILACCFMAPGLKAQSISVGASGGTSFGELFIGPTVEVKLPLKRLEIDARDTFAPFESHIKLGHGSSNVTTLEPSLWLTKSFGLDGRLDWSEYHNGNVSKHSPYAFGGIAVRSSWEGAPVDIKLDYFREFNNGIYGRGIETSHLQGGSLYLEAEIGCAHHTCYYTTLEMAVGGLLEQGNPECDGTEGRVTCPRTRNVSGSGIMGFLVRWGKR